MSFISVSEGEETTKQLWLNSIRVVEQARATALSRLSALPRRSNSKEAENMAVATRELTRLLTSDAKVLEPSDMTKISPDEKLIVKLVCERGVFLLRQRLSAWEDIHRLQRTFWLALASFANESGVQRRRHALLERVLNADALVKFASNDTRSAWLPARNEASLQSSCEFVMLMLHAVDKLGECVRGWLSGQREASAQLPPPVPTAQSSRVGTRGTLQTGGEAEGGMKKLSTTEKAMCSFVPIGTQHQAIIPTYDSTYVPADRGDVLLHIEYEPLTRPPSSASSHVPVPVPTTSSMTKRIVKPPKWADGAVATGMRTPTPTLRGSLQKRSRSPVKFAELTNQQGAGCAKAERRVKPKLDTAFVCPLTEPLERFLWCHEVCISAA